MRVLQIANYSEGGGISSQVKLIHKHLVADGFTCGIFSTKGSIIKRFLSVFRLLFYGTKYDVFHIHACSDYGFFPAIIGVSIGRLLNKRTVLTFHGGGAESFFQRRKSIVLFFLRRTDSNIVLSEFIGKVYRKYGLSYSVIPNFVELNPDVYRERSNIAPRFIGIRSFYEIYNNRCTLCAFRNVQGKFPNASLYLLGDGPQREKLEAFVKENQIKNVFFTGHINNEDIYHYLNKCDIMLSSSYFDNMPVSILEGFNAGLLVIASKVGGVPYMIQDGENGLLFESDNNEEMAQKMIFALENPKRVQLMVKKAHQSLKHYSWDYCCPKLLSLYKGD